MAACLRSVGPAATRVEEVRTFGTTTRELLRLADWLTGAGGTHVTMESTGVYWRPVFHVLEDMRQRQQVELALGPCAMCGETAPTYRL